MLMLLGYVGSFVSLENNLRSESKPLGIARAKAKGVYKGGKKKLILNKSKH